MNKLLGELRRRNVFRVATTYLVIGWLIVQVVDTLSRPLGLPDWILTLVFIILATGFPVVVVSSWTFDLTDNGVEHTDLADPDQQPAVSSASGLNIVLISALAIALGYFIWESRFSSPLTMVDTQANTSQTPDPAAFRLITDKSIAVLPFDDFSPDADQGWFVNGLSEEIVNALVRTADLSCRLPNLQLRLQAV